MKILIFDTETSGLPPRLGWDRYPNPSDFNQYDGSRLIELGYIVYDDGQEIQRYDKLVVPKDFEITNSQIHGITTEKATIEGSQLESVLNQLMLDIGSCDRIIAHNINFDLHIILAEAYRCKNMELVNHMYLKDKCCTMALGKKNMEVRKVPKLIELYEWLFNETFDQKHRALSDVEACARCYFKLVPNQI